MEEDRTLEIGSDSARRVISAGCRRCADKKQDEHDPEHEHEPDNNDDDEDDDDDDDHRRSSLLNLDHDIDIDTNKASDSASPPSSSHHIHDSPPESHYTYTHTTKRVRLPSRVASVVQLLYQHRDGPSSYWARTDRPYICPLSCEELKTLVGCLGLQRYYVEMAGGAGAGVGDCDCGGTGPAALANSGADGDGHTDTNTNANQNGDGDGDGDLQQQFEPDDLFDLGAYLATHIKWRFDRDLHLFVMLLEPSPLHEHLAAQIPVLVLDLAKQSAAVAATTVSASEQEDVSSAASIANVSASASTGPWMQILETVSVCTRELYFPGAEGHNADADADTSGVYNPSVPPTEQVTNYSGPTRSSGEQFHKPWHPEPDNSLCSAGHLLPAMIFETVFSNDVPLRAKNYIVRGYPHVRCVFKLKIPYKAAEARLERLPRPMDIYPLKVDIYRLARGTNGQFGWSQKSYTICRKGTKVDVELRLSDICRGLPKDVTVRIPADRIIDVAEEAAAMQARHDTKRKLEEEELEEARRQDHLSTSDPFALDQQIAIEFDDPFDLP